MCLRGDARLCALSLDLSYMEFSLHIGVVVTILFLVDRGETEAQRDDVSCLQITQLVSGDSQVLSQVRLRTQKDNASLTAYLGRILSTAGQGHEGENWVARGTC